MKQLLMSHIFKKPREHLNYSTDPDTVQQQLQMIKPETSSQSETFQLRADS